MVIALSAPPLIAAIIFGVLISLIQTLFQIQDQTLPFTIKLIAIAITLASSASWMGSEFLGLTSSIFELIPIIEP